MKISEIAELIKAEICTKNYDDSIDIFSACSADLIVMSWHFPSLMHYY